MIQIPVPIAEDSDAFKAGYSTIADLSKERIRRAGKYLLEKDSQETSKLDVGFRVLKVDSSNMIDVFYTPDDISQDLLSGHASNIKRDRSAEDLLFQVLLDWGVELSLPIHKEIIQGKEVLFVDQNALVACFDNLGAVDESLVKELAKQEPMRAVFCDSGFKSDDVRINIEQIFKLISPATEVKTI
jgi:adenine-specific DNA-methyltransferase